MKLKLSILALSVLAFQGCSISNENIVQEEPAVEQYIDVNAPICGEYSDGTKQTFPTLKDLENDPDAHLLHEGPCY